MVVVMVGPMRMAVNLACWTVGQMADCWAGREVLTGVGLGAG